MESKIEIELTEKEASHLRTLLEGGIKISDSISQGEIFKNILDHLNSQDQEENEPEKVCVDPIVPDFIAEKLAEERYNTREILLNGTKPLEVEDTPEQTESDVQEWEEEWHSTPVYNQISFIKNLLKEREREVFTKEELECIFKWKDACDGEFNCLSLLPSSGEDWGKEEDIESAEEKLRDLLDKLKDNK